MPLLEKWWHSMHSDTLSLKTIRTKLDFLKKTGVIQWNIRKKNQQLFATKLTEKIPDPRNAKKHYQSFLGKENTKSVKQSKIILSNQKLLKGQLLLI